VPLLVSLHGAGSNGSQDELFTGWSGFADTNDFIVAYPDAGFPDDPSTAYYGGGVWDPYTTSSTDEGFIDSVVSSVESTYCVDPSRVYVDGWSNGAVMSQRMACNAANVFAAADSYAGGDPTVYQTGSYQGQYSGDPCAPSRPISMAMIVGQEDFTYGGLSEDASMWDKVDGCTGSGASETDQYGSSTTTNCAGGSQVMTRVVNYTSHNWPSGAQGVDQRQRIWSFFMAHPLT
jgi:polyhydroxybutyrate depolymerase